EHVEATEAAGSSDHIVVHDVDADSPYRYCTGFLLLKDRDDLGAAEVRRLMEPLGDSLLVVGDESALRVHVHTDDPGSALSRVVDLGSLTGVEISDMQAQVKDRTERLTHRPEAGTPKRRCDVVAVVQGAGATRLAGQLGARAVVDGGQTQNPSTEQLLEAIESCNSDEVVVLPNNDNILLAARSAAGLASRPVVVVETSSIPAGLIALGSYTAGLSAEENGATMRASVNRMADGAITRASRDARVDGVPVDKGAWIGLVDGRLVATSQRVSEVASRVAAAMLGPNRQRLMLLRGGEHVVPDDLDDAIARVAEAYPHVQIDQHDGGQDHYPLLLAAYAAEERLEASTTAIVFDSTADISGDRVTNPSWKMVPLTLRFGDEEFVDGVTLTGAQFYDRLKHTDQIARTAAPSPGAFEVAYRDLLERYRTVVSLHISGKLSATVESARTGATELGDRVRVYDTYVTSALLGLVVEAVQRMLDEGTSAAALDEFVRQIPSRSGISFSLDTLEYLQRNGRIGRGKALIGGLLRVRPILSLVNGEVDAVRRVRGKRAAIPALVDDMLKRSAGFDRIDVAILHADSERDAERLARTVRESRSGITSMQTVGIGAVIGAHVGPGALGIAFLAR
ncbi:MAG: DegV family EDD domain-containing protein, partial [Acidimicrobiales bacterium]|nr:DegV family EDD domain-containing protein [Acidimicrobiales bacterium]